MDWVNIAFWAFSAIAVVAAGAVISVRNPVYAVLCLILTFFSVACVWLLVGAEFLGVALILVYVGAVMVLFLFVVMMLDIDFASLKTELVSFVPVGGLIALVLWLIHWRLIRRALAVLRSAPASATQPAT